MYGKIPLHVATLNHPMQIKYLLSGSFAYDTLLPHAGHFHARILPEQVSRLSVAFGVGGPRDEFGGTAGNIAYNAALLGSQPVLVGNVGADFARYRAHLTAQGLDTSALRVHPQQATPHAWVLTDAGHNQITAFHTGALACEIALPSIAETVPLWHLAPEHPENMVALALRAGRLSIPYFFDPGQALPALLEKHALGELDLRDVLWHAKGLFVNDYEAALLTGALGAPLEGLLGLDGFVVHTQGAKGASIVTATGTEFVAAARPSKVVDPTGCGDALRAGFVHAYLRGADLPDCLALGSALASFVVERVGGQSHTPGLPQVEARVRGPRLASVQPA